MSADNGIYILESKDGFRVTHAQAIDNLWWPGNKLNPVQLKKYFGECKVFKSLKEAYSKAKNIKYQVGYVEYGISFIEGWEDKDFPE